MEFGAFTGAQAFSLFAEGDDRLKACLTLPPGEYLALLSHSGSRDVPPSYYGAASNYALLLLGDPDAKLQDGGPDKDDRRNLHFLAVPVIAPKGDAGTDEPADGGAAPGP